VLDTSRFQCGEDGAAVAPVRPMLIPNHNVATHQRATDWFASRIGRTIQSVAGSKWFGQMEVREL
jgi:hypothetical protein